MFTLFNTESLWIGTDLKKFNEIRDILDREGICYKYKVSDQLGLWMGKGLFVETLEASAIHQISSSSTKFW